MTYAKEKAEIEFAYKVRRAMTESTENIPDATLERLANARQIALSRQKKEIPSAVFAFGGVLASGNGASFFQRSGFRKLIFALSLIVLMIGLYSIYQHEQQQQIDDLAEIDAAVLVDELPPDAYLDSGFNAYLNNDTQDPKEEDKE